jgi:hypothetical protein
MTRLRLVWRAAVAIALAALSAGPVFPSNAAASVSVAVTWDGLIRESTAAAVVTANEGVSVWEAGRIYTYTHVRVERSVAGALPANDAWVRTMGGVVGKIGQLVDGEAVLSPGQSSLLFLKAGPVGAFDVTARGQGQFPVTSEDPGHPGRVAKNRAVGMLLPPRIVGPSLAPRLAADVLDGRTVDDVAEDILAAWSTVHAP